MQSKKKSLLKPLLCCCRRPSHDNTIANQKTTVIIMEEKKNSNSPLRREKSDLTGASVKWVGDKPSASKNPFRYSYLVLRPIYFLCIYFLQTFCAQRSHMYYVQGVPHLRCFYYRGSQYRNFWLMYYLRPVKVS